MASNEFSGKSALILGCGYVGTAVGRYLTERGATVTALTRNADRIAEAKEWAASAVACDLDSRDWHSQVDARQDYVLNCVSSAGGGLDGYRKSYVGGMESILEWAAQADIGTFAYTSATSVYPHSDGSLVTEEDVPSDLTASGALLRESEVLVESASGAWQRAFILRLGAIYGPTRHHLLDALKRGQTTFPGEADFYLNYIHLDDILSATIAAFSAGASHTGGAFNVIDGAYPTKREVVEWLAEQIGVEKPVFDPGQQTARAANRTNPVGQMPNRRVSNEKLRRELGWSPKYPSYREGYAAFL
ncbi:MAG: NAD-dependent epimerase/dehydratase family protein [Puniceicoccales bacterium]